MHLSILFDHPVGDLWVVQEHLLLPHLLDSLVCVALQGVVVLVDLDAEAANSGEVVRLGQVTQAVVLHRLQDVLHPHPLPPRVPRPPLPRLGPDLVKARHNKSASEQKILLIVFVLGLYN